MAHTSGTRGRRSDPFSDENNEIGVKGRRARIIMAEGV